MIWGVFIRAPNLLTGGSRNSAKWWSSVISIELAFVPFVKTRPCVINTLFLRWRGMPLAEKCKWMVDDLRVQETKKVEEAKGSASDAAQEPDELVSDETMEAITALDMKSFEGRYCFASLSLALYLSQTVYMYIQIYYRRLLVCICRRK